MDREAQCTSTANDEKAKAKNGKEFVDSLLKRDGIVCVGKTPKRPEEPCPMWLNEDHSRHAETWHVECVEGRRAICGVIIELMWT
eukprot:scaffold146396_cov73-Cyclotella_meneghiniana.AAC.1